MNDDTNSALLELTKYVLRLHCRHEVTKGALVGLVSREPKAVEKILSELDTQATKMFEDMLLKIGDTDPRTANLLGVAEFLKRLQ